MKRVYGIVPRIAHHRVARMPHLVGIASRSGRSRAQDIGAARGLITASTICMMFWAAVVYLT